VNYSLTETSFATSRNMFFQIIKIVGQSRLYSVKTYSIFLWLINPLNVWLNNRNSYWLHNDRYCRKDTIMTFHNSSFFSLFSFAILRYSNWGIFNFASIDREIRTKRSHEQIHTWLHRFAEETNGEIIYEIPIRDDYPFHSCQPHRNSRSSRRNRFSRSSCFALRRDKSRAVFYHYCAE